MRIEELVEEARITGRAVQVTAFPCGCWVATDVLDVLTHGVKLCNRHVQAAIGGLTGHELQLELLERGREPPAGGEEKKATASDSELPF